MSSVYVDSNGDVVSLNGGVIKAADNSFSSYSNKLVADTKGNVVSVNGGTLRIPDETFNTYVKKTIPCGRNTYSTNQVYTTIFLLCATSHLTTVKLKMRVKLSTKATFTPILQVLHGETEEIFTKQYNITSTEISDTVEFTYQFYPSQTNNRFRIQIKNQNRVCTDLFQLLDTEVEVSGRNITILNRERDFKVYTSKDYYYLTKNYIDTGEYKKVYVHDPFDIYTDYTTFPQLIARPTSSALKTTNIWNYNYTYLPYIIYDSATDKFICSQTDDRFSGTNSMNASAFVVNASEVPVNHTSGFKNASSQSYIASFSHPGELPSGAVDTNMRNTSFVYHYYNYAPAISLSTNTSGYSTSRIKVNGNYPTGIYVENTSVIAKDWEDNSHRPYYSIATDDMGQNTFFNGKNATYTVDLGFGTQVNAYMQSDTSINVYMRVIDHIYKKVMQINSQTNQYEVVSSIDLGEGLEFIEGHYDDYFINKNGTWEYYPPTNNS